MHGEVHVTSPAMALQHAAIIDGLYPNQALRTHIEGSASLRCRLSDGAFRACVVTSESDPALGFGRAALQATIFLTPDPRASREQVSLTFTFSNPRGGECVSDLTPRR
jgi:TonB family protein